MRSPRFSACLLAFGAAALLQSATAGSAADADGTLHTPGYTLALPDHLSPQARAALIGQLQRNTAPKAPPEPFDVLAVRKAIADGAVPTLQRLRALYPVDVRDTVIGGVHAVEVTPKGGVPERNRRRVLIDLHGGGFRVGAASDIGLMESIPLAGRLGIRVLSLDYRQGPEHTFPAASEDVAAVYRDLLKRHPAQAIGIYGCSAGGLLTAQAVAWFDREKLPQPGAIGILCASADARWAGDSLFTVPPTLGNTPPDPKAPPVYDEQSYYGDADLSAPLMSPIYAPALLAKFPPTLLITGTRSEEMSAAVDTHRRLVKADVDADLHVWDGMWHGFFVGNPDMPEANEAFDVIAAFFDRRLGR